jgi:hypothetical protein
LGWLAIIDGSFQASSGSWSQLLNCWKRETSMSGVTLVMKLFKNLKKLLTTSLVLAQPDTDKPFDVYCDNYGTELGVS